MKNNKSLRTVALWVFLIVIFIMIYQTVSKSGAGKPVQFSDFINNALPPSYVQNSTPPAMGTVTVYQTGPNAADALIEYSVNRTDDGRAATAEELAKSRRDFFTRGDVRIPLGVAEGGQTLYNALSDRGIAVTFAKAPDAAWNPRGTEEPFSAFVTDVLTIKPRTNVSKITVRGKEITGTYANGQATFTTVGDLAPYRSALVARGITVVEEPDGEGSIWLSILGTWLPTLFIFFLVFLFLRQMQAGGGKAMSFGKSRAKLLSDHHHKVTFADVAGAEEAKHEVQEIVEFLRDPKRFTRLGGRIPKGVLLMGPPGTGKTLLARAIAGEAGVPFFSISGSDFVEMFVGVGASRVRDMFEQGKKNAPCIIFIDEIDAVGRHRGAGLGGGHDEREQTLNQLLVEMDGFESNDGVILDGGHEPPRRARPGLAAAGALRPPRGRQSPRREGPARDPQGPHAQGARVEGRRARGHRARHPGLRGRRLGEPRQRGRVVRGAWRQGLHRDGRLRVRQGQGPHGGRARAPCSSRRRRSATRRFTRLDMCWWPSRWPRPTRCTRSRSFRGGRRSG